jgi:hypothetical protein
MTVQAVIDRINRDYLQAPGEFPTRLYLQNAIGTPITSITGSSSDDVIAKAAHGLSNGDKVIFTAITGGTGLSTYTTYYVVGAATNTFQVALTAGGTALTFADFTAGTVVELSSVTSTAVQLVVNTSWLTPEEEDMLAPGAKIDVDLEVMLVEAVSGTSPSFTLTVRRAMDGTTAATHSDGTFTYLITDDYVPRYTIFTAVADAIESCWPDLWQVGVEETWTDTSPVEIPAVVGEIMDMRVASGYQWRRIGSWEELQNFPLSSTGNAVQFNGVTSNAAVHLVYKKKTTRPTLEADTLADLGVEDGWVKVIVVDAVAQIVARTDLNKATQDFITQSLEAEGFAPGSGADIRNSFLQLKDFSMRSLKRQQDQKLHSRVVIDRAY